MIVKGNCEDERRGLNAKIFIHFNYIANAPINSSYVVDANELITYLWRKVKWKERNFSPFNQKTLWAAGEWFMLLLTSSIHKTNAISWTWIFFFSEIPCWWLYYEDFILSNFHWAQNLLRIGRKISKVIRNTPLL